MANPSGKKGSAFARLIANYFADTYDDRIDRRVETGRFDKGDIGGVRLGPHRIVVEVKNHARMELGQWVKEAVVEAENDKALIGVVAHKRKGYAQAGDQYVTLRLSDFVGLLLAVSDPPNRLEPAEPTEGQDS
jgi:hypothetical protein